MKKLSGCFIICFCLLSPFFSKAQAASPHLDSIAQQLTNSITHYYKSYPQEKIFIHTDINTYLSGQTIWYKVYDMAYGKPSQLSKIVYVRLYDEDNKLIRQDKLPLKNSTAYGNINLPDSLKTGWYGLRGFTSWMLNFGSDGFYNQLIYVQNFHDKSVAPPLATNGSVYHIKFFPEGGDMVDGTICNIAFKATDEHGLPATVYGNVIDNDKKKVTELKTVHDGMGSFELEVSAATGYTAQVHFPDNSMQMVALPMVKKTGISLRVNTGINSELEARITYAGQQVHRSIILTAVQNNGLSVNYPLILSRGTNIISIKKSEFSTGILRLTVFDENGLPGAERIVFINNNDQLKLSLSKDTLSFNPKNKNIFTINLRNDGHISQKANFSVAITDAAIADLAEDNIYSYFLMSSELRGYIHQPAWYFKNNSDTLRQQLDLVMLTNGWRHFNWYTVLNTKPIALKHAVENSLFIAGKVENYHDKDNLRVKLMITYQDSNKYVGEIEPDSAGLFILNDYSHPGTANLHFEVVNTKNKKQPAKVIFFTSSVDTINLKDFFLNPIAITRPIINKTFLDSVLMVQNTRFITRGVVLKQVNIKGQKSSPTELAIKTHVQRLKADNAQTLDLVNAVSAPNGTIIDYMLGKFPGLKIIQTTDGGVDFTYHGASEISSTDKTKAAKSEPPYFYIDEASATLSDVETMPITDVALIVFAPPPVWFAPLNGGNEGAILIYTKKIGDEKNFAKSTRKAFDQYTFNGYSVTREFSSPDYSVILKNKQPDYRTTLYWNHDLNTDEEGNIKIRFYNSDKAKRYRVIVQGIDAEGRVGYLDEVL